MTRSKKDSRLEELRAAWQSLFAAQIVATAVRDETVPRLRAIEETAASLTLKLKADPVFAKVTRDLVRLRVQIRWFKESLAAFCPECGPSEEHPWAEVRRGEGLRKVRAP